MNNTHPSGLYLHIPFCRSKCSYCAFYSIPDTSVSLAQAWLKAMHREMAFYEAAFPPFDTMYLGGGTPSVLDGEMIASLIEEAFRRFRFHPDVEITLEANPDDLSIEALSFYRGLGINRLSLGAQSFDDTDLLALGRRHSAVQTKRALEAARWAGFDNISIDLIMGIPIPTSDPTRRWLRTLDEALSFRPEHLSCYLLTYEEGSALEAGRIRGEVTPLSEETERTLFLLTSHRLRAAGYIHYEVSSFARSDSLRSRHNGKYWCHAPYLGLGPSAHSFLNGTRWWNVRSVERFCQMLSESRLPVAGRETLSAGQIHLEQLFLGLRTAEGISRRLLGRGGRTEATLAALCDEGLLHVDGTRIVPTVTGYLVSDGLPLLLLGD